MTKQEYVLKALNIGFQHNVDPGWFSLQLERYWHFWTSEKKYPHYPLLRNWWIANSQYTQKVLVALSLSEGYASDLMDCLLSFPGYIREHRIVDLKLIENPVTYSEQIIVLLQGLRIMDNSRSFVSGEIELRLGKSLQILPSDKRKSPFRTAKTSISPSLSAILDRLIERSDLMPQLKACLWAVYWSTHQLTEPMVTSFLKECTVWSGNQALSKFLERTIRNSQPILALVLENQMEINQNRVVHLRPYLNVQETSISRQVATALKEGLTKLSYEEQLATVLSYHYTAHHFPELSSIAEQLGVDSNKLIEMYVYISISSPIKLSSVILQQIFSYFEDDLVQIQKLSLRRWIFSRCEWNLDLETAQQGMRLLHALIEILPQRPTIIADILMLFFKLLSFDATPLLVASVILSYLAEEVYLKDNLIFWTPPYDVIYGITAEHLIVLANFITHEDTKVRQGAITLWAEFIEAHATLRLSPKLDVLGFDCGLSLALIKDTDAVQRKKGIMLLTYSHFPIGEKQYSAALRSAIMQAQGDDEIQAWRLFLRKVPVSRSEKKAWQKWLETLLYVPQSYSSGVLSAVMERYMELVGVAGPEIKNERELELPVLALSKRKRSGR